MLRIIHTADWHLGQTFHLYERDYEHAQFLAWLLKLIAERKPDVLLLSGDVFDSYNPSANAQRRYYQFLHEARATLPTLQMVVIAGNHDAAARLEAPAGLLEGLNIHVVGTVSRPDGGEVAPSKFIVPLRNAQGEVRALALALPFLRSSDVPLLSDARDPYHDGVRELYHQVTGKAAQLRDAQYPGSALVALGHCHMQDAVESRDSERRIVIGGAEALSTDIFPPELAYVALGHLHKPQELDGGRVRYSGSPIPLSFSEKEYEHRVLEVLLEEGHLVSVTGVPVPRVVPLVRVPQGKAVAFSELLKQLAELPAQPELPSELHPFLEVRVLDDGPDPTRRRRIEEALEGKAVRLASLRLDPVLRENGEDGGEDNFVLEDLGSLDPLEIMLGAHEERYQCAPEESVVGALKEVLQEIGL